MENYHIAGGNKLEGKYYLSGAKNAVLPILAATILSGSISIIKDCPNLSDIETMVAILEKMGCEVIRDENNIQVDSSTLDTFTIPKNLMKEIRSSVFLMGPTLARCGKVIISNPGGCEIGERPIDIHISALQRLGVKIKEKEGLLECEADRLVGNEIFLEFPSVGATENVMMAAVMAEGETNIFNPAREPEIVDLQNFLRSCGAEIYGAGTNRIRIVGKKRLKDTTYKVIPDRIVGGTILSAVAATGGKILLTNTIPSQMSNIIRKLTEAGCEVDTGNDFVSLNAPAKLTGVKPFKTLPYPGFPTDLQSQLVTLMTIAKGTTYVTETIFENRFKYLEGLKRMGANVKVEGRTAVVTGQDMLVGNKVVAEDLRGGASLVIAGLIAKGDTIIKDICHIDRGYDKFEITLKELGADIKRIKS